MKIYYFNGKYIENGFLNSWIDNSKSNEKSHCLVQFNGTLLALDGAEWNSNDTFRKEGMHPGELITHSPMGSVLMLPANSLLWVTSHYEGCISAEHCLEFNGEDLSLLYTKIDCGQK